MRASTAQRLIELDKRFYETHAASFSSTRRSAWPGWTRVFAAARDALQGAADEPGRNADGEAAERYRADRASDSARAPRQVPRHVPDGAPADAGEHAVPDSAEATAACPVASPAAPVAAPPDRPSVLDLACGNMRLAAALAEGFPGTHLDYHGVDACDELAATAPVSAGRAAGPDRLTVSHQSLDILDELLEHRGDARARIAAPDCDLVCCFGFLHHVPGTDLRRALVELLVSCARPGGVVALSCWRFMDDGRLAAKARAATELVRQAGGPLDLDPGDYFLGWQDDLQAPRYCHHVDEAELDDLSRVAAEVGAREICRFSADGRSGALNRYLILQRI